MKSVLRNSFLLAMVMMVVMAGCTMDDAPQGNGNGTLKINGDAYSVDATTTTQFFSCSICGYGSDRDGRQISFAINEGHRVILNIGLIQDLELTSKTYTKNETEVCHILLFDVINDKGYLLDNVVMDVIITDKTYDITITGKSLENKMDYTIAFKGKIRKVAYK